MERDAGSAEVAGLSARAPVVNAPMTFEAFYEREFRRVVALAYPLTGSWAVAEELAQDAFIAAHRSWRRVSGYDRPDYWVRRVATNRAFSAYRRRQYEQRALRRLDTATETATIDSDLGWLVDHIRLLPTKQSLAVALVYVEQWSIAEAAEILECSASTLRTHLQRAREALQRSIRDAEAADARGADAESEADDAVR